MFCDTRTASRSHSLKVIWSPCSNVCRLFYFFYSQCKDIQSQENHMIPFTVHLSAAYVSPPFRNLILMASAKYIRSILSTPWPQRLLEIWRKGEWKIIKCITVWFFISKSAQTNQLCGRSRNTVSVQDLGKDPCLEQVLRRTYANALKTKPVQNNTILSYFLKKHFTHIHHTLNCSI